MKISKKCNRDKSLSNFQKDPGYKDGLKQSCKTSLEDVERLSNCAMYLKKHKPNIPNT